MEIYYFIFVLIFLLLFQAPVYVAVGVSALVGLALAGLMDMTAIFATLHSLNSYTMLAIPFYILAGNIMSKGSIASELLNVAVVLAGGRRSAIGIATLLACAFFAAISGSAIVTVAAIGAITIPMMIKQGYKPSYAAAIVASGAVVGPIIPPSLTMVIYGIAAQTSISELFMGGIFPGLLLTLGFIITLLLTAKKGIDHSVPLERQDLTVLEKLKAVWAAKWALFMPILVLGGIYSGIFTPTEAAIVACDYALIVSFLINRDMSLKTLFSVSKGTILTTGQLMILIGISNAFGKVLTMNMIPQAFSSLVLSITDSHIIILLLINVIGLIIGCFMEGTTAIVLLTPILLPLAQVCGLTPVEFGVILCVNMAMGTLTPPFGLNLFITSSMTGQPVFEIARQVLPFLLSSIVVIYLITYVPQIISYLPNLLK